MNMASDPIRNMLQKDLERKTAELKAGFAALAQSNTRSVPENIFVTHFLPLFCGESQENKSVLLDNWYAIAGTPYSPVNVVDIYGNVIVTVPPILNREVLPVKIERDNGDLSDVFETAARKAEFSPKLGENHVVNELSKRFLSTIDTSPNDALKAQWAAVFSKYGKGAKTATAAQPATESDFEYE